MSYNGFTLQGVNNTTVYDYKAIKIYGDAAYTYRYYIKNTYSKGSTKYGTVSSTSESAYPTDGKSGDYWYIYNGTSKGSLIKTVYGKEGQYPDDGIQDGYWYELA